MNKTDDIERLPASAGSGKLVEVSQELRRMAAVLGTTLEGRICELAADIVRASGKQAVALQALRGALAFIADFGGKGIDTECGRIQCTGSWCAEQANAALSQNSCIQQPPSV